MTIQKDKQHYDEKTHQWVEVEPAKARTDEPVPAVKKPASQPAELKE
jgi:hypothetical protein